MRVFRGTPFTPEISAKSEDDNCWKAEQLGVPQADDSGGATPSAELPLPSLSLFFPFDLPLPPPPPAPLPVTSTVALALKLCFPKLYI